MRRWAQLAILLLGSSGVAPAWAQAPADADEDAAEEDASEDGPAKDPEDVELGDWADDDDDTSDEGGDPEDVELGDWADDDDDEDEGDVEPEPPSSGAAPGEITPERLERRRASRQAALEAAEPRPPLPEVEGPEVPPWARRLEVGAHFAVVERPFSDALVPGTGIGYKPAPGFGVQLRWNIVSWLRLHAYFHDAHHAIDLPAGGLRPNPATGIPADATLEVPKVTTFSFGVALAPTWNITDRFRGWLSVGIGWGLFEFSGITVTPSSGQPATAPPRDGVFLEVPIGLGLAFDVIEDWLAVDVQAIAAPATGQSGGAHDPGQVLLDGTTYEIGPFPAAEVSFVQTIGLSLIL